MLSKGSVKGSLLLILFQSLAQAQGYVQTSRQVCGNRGDTQCDCLDGKFLVKPLRCDFRSFQCWGSNSRLAVSQCCQPCVISAASPWSLYPQPCAGSALSPSWTGTSRSFSSVHVLYCTKSLHSQCFAVSLTSHKAQPSQGYLACSKLKMSFDSLFQQK